MPPLFYCLTTSDFVDSAYSHNIMERHLLGMIWQKQGENVKTTLCTLLMHKYSLFHSCLLISDDKSFITVFTVWSDVCCVMGVKNVSPSWPCCTETWTGFCSLGRCFQFLILFSVLGAPLCVQAYVLVVVGFQFCRGPFVWKSIHNIALIAN